MLSKDFRVLMSKIINYEYGDNYNLHQKKYKMGYHIIKMYI